MNSKITARDYDSRVLGQDLQFQIDNYYEPKEASMNRRVRMVLEAANPRANENILDVGCGVGTFAFHAAKSGAIAFGADYSIESIEVAQKLVRMYNVADKAKFVVADATMIPFRDSCFDKVIAADFIEHITFEQKDKLLREIYRVLKTGGIGVIFTPNGIREKIGEAYWKFKHWIFKDTIPGTELHFGLTNRYQFEPLLKRHKFNFRLLYRDVTRPCLANIPLIRNFLSLNLLWILKKI